MTPKHDCPYLQEPENGGNSGNSGNGQQRRGLQPFPPINNGGNKWEHTNHSQYKRLHAYIQRLSLFPHFSRWEQIGNTFTLCKARFRALFPPFPLFPPFFNSQQHVIRRNQGMVTL